MRFCKDIELACEELGIEFEAIGSDGKWHALSRLQKTVYVQLDRFSLSLETFSSKIARDKLLTRSLLSKCGEPVIKGVQIDSAEEVEECLDSKIVEYPLVIKPVCGDKSIGVFADIRTKAEVEEAFDVLRYHGLLREKVMVERFVSWTDVSILVLDGVFLAASIRRPPSIVGDGIRTIASLASDLGIDADSVETRKILSHQDLTPGCCPPKHTVVRVLNRRNNELGTATDITDEVHECYSCAAQRCAAILRSRIASVDLFAENHLEPGQYMVNEVNYGASLLAFMYPDSGVGRPVHISVLKAYFGMNE